MASRDAFEKRFMNAVITSNKRDVLECVLIFQTHSLQNININEILCEGIQTGQIEIVRLLLGVKYVDLTYKGEDGKRPIHHAAEAGNAEMVKMVIDAGSIVNVLDGNNGFSALHYAARGGHAEVVKVLVREGAHVNRNRTFTLGEAPIHMACAAGHVNVVQVLINVGANINVLTSDTSQQTPLHKAIQCRQYEVIQALIEGAADITITDEAGRSPLHLAAEVGSVRTFLQLIGLGVTEMPVDKRGRKPIHIAVTHKQTEIVETLVAEIPGDIDAADIDGLTPLLLAVLGGMYPILKVLLDAGAAVNCVELTIGASALNLAVSTGRLDMVRCLLENGADPTITDFRGVTPLHRAQILKPESRSTIVRLLIMYGAKMNTPEEHGYTPLDRCVFQTVLSNFDKETLKFMTSAGAHLQPVFTEKRLHRNSPLCWLVWREDLESARFLVNAGWNLKQETWLDLPGRNEEHTQFIAWLRKLLSEPRTLVHTCRESIRERLSFCSDDRQILSAIETLPIPTVMKKFLKFQEEMDMFK